MLWYVIQTYTGKEERLVEMIRQVVPRELYGDCFVVYYEQLRKRQQQNQVHVERTFPGYVFITSDDPENLFLYLKKVPAMSRLMSDGAFYFLPLDAKEAEFLGTILDEDHVTRLSYVNTDGRDHVSLVTGPLENCLSRLIRYQFRKRYAVIRLRLSGEEKEVRLGIVLNDDIRRELAYGKVEAPIQVPERYQVPVSVGRTSRPDMTPDKTDTEPVGETFQPGDVVTVVSGTFAGMPARVYQIKKNAVKIGVRMFGQDMTVEVPIETVRKTVT